MHLTVAIGASLLKVVLKVGVQLVGTSMDLDILFGILKKLVKL